MTPEAQRIAIAESCGWKCCEPKPQAKNSPYARWVNKADDIREFRNVPNYGNSLDALREAVRKLTGDQRSEFCEQLVDVLKRDSMTAAYIDDFDMLTATAEQQAEALLRTLGLWEDGR